MLEAHIARSKEPAATNGKRRTSLKQMEPEVAQAAALLGMRFARWDLLREAITHRSYLNEEANATQSNERLEFLGDAVLGYLIAQYLFHRYRGAPEGQLTRRRVALVSNQTLARWARRIGLEEVLLISKGERGIEQPDRVLGGAFEALLAAIMLDRGLEAAAEFLTPILDSDADAVMDAAMAGNHKGRLQEVVQERDRLTPTYMTIGTEGPDHERQFVVAVMVGDREIARGMGKSKQLGEQAAAEAALAIYDGNGINAEDAKDAEDAEKEE